jgi:transcriptional regulator with XRE-family HTH domain
VNASPVKEVVHISENRPEPTDLTRAVGARIRRVREAAEMTQDALAEAVGYRNGSSITYIEQGRNAIGLDTLLLICATLKISPNELFGWKGWT